MKNQKAKSHVSQYLIQFVEQLKEAKLRVTQPRIEVYKVLLKKHGPFTAEEILQEVGYETCDLATVYRSLAVLEKARIIRKCVFDDGINRYECSEKKSRDHHHHIICRQCRKIESVSDCGIDLVDDMARTSGFTQVSHSLEYFGLCPKCS